MYNCSPLEAGAEAQAGEVAGPRSRKTLGSWVGVRIKPHVVKTWVLGPAVVKPAVKMPNALGTCSGQRAWPGIGIRRPGFESWWLCVLEQAA